MGVEPIINHDHENNLLIKLLKEKNKEIEQLKLEYELLNQELGSVKPSFESQSEDNLGNKERILNLLKSDYLTSKEIAERLSLSKQDTRTYLQRLKKEDKIKVVEKKGQFLVYALKKPLSSAKEYSAPESLEYDLSYLLNLMEMKMTLKDGVKFTPVDLMNIKKIEKRITDKKRENKQGTKALREFIDFEKSYKEEINEKLAELETKVNYITSGKEAILFVREQKIIDLEKLKKEKTKDSEIIFNLINRAERLAQQYEVKKKEGILNIVSPFQEIINIYIDAKKRFEVIGWNEQAGQLINSINYYKEKLEADNRLRALETQKLEKKQEKEQAFNFMDLAKKEMKQNKFEGMKIVSVDVPESYIDAINKLIGENGLYPSRSELVRCAVRDFLLKELKAANIIANFNDINIEDFDDEHVFRIPIEKLDENSKPVREFKTYKIVKRLEY